VSGAWLAPVGVLADALVRGDAAVLAHVRELVASGAVDALVLGADRLAVDALPSTEPVGVATVLAGRLPGVGLVTVSGEPADHPYHTARRTLTLDHLTGARTGVLFAGGGLPGKETAERVRLVRELWNTWPVGSIVGDRDARVYAHVEEVRDVAHVGARYSVAGALGTPSSRQGEPVSAAHVTTSDEVAALAGLVDVLVVDDVGLVDDRAGSRLYVRLVAGGSHAAGSHAAGSHAAGSHAAGSHAAGSHAAGPHAAGPHAAGPRVAGSSGTAVPAGADGVVLVVADPADLPRVDDGPDAATAHAATAHAAAAHAAAASTLRGRLGLPPRTVDLSDRPRTFGAPA